MMRSHDDAVDEDIADVFAVPDFWGRSQWLEAPVEETPSPFFNNELKEIASTGVIQLPKLDTPESSFFKLPTLEAPHPEEAGGTLASNKADVIPQAALEVSYEAAENTDLSVESLSGATDLFSEVWLDLDNVSTKPPKHKTWDAFLTRSAATSQPLLVTEVGPATYDAMLASPLDPLRLKNQDVPTVESKPYFASLLALSLGQESVFFQRQENGRSLVPALPEMRISGYSRDVLQGLEKQCFSCGSIFLELHSFVRSTYSKTSTRCRVALASALEQILKVAQEHVSVQGRDPQTLLRLQSTLRGLLALLEPFQRLTSKLSPRCSDEDVLNIVFYEAYSLDHGEEQLREIMREVLRRVSRPWVEFLEEWVGTKREEGIPLTKLNVGQIKGFVKVETETFIDDFGQEVEDTDFRLDEVRMPNFMAHDIALSIFETGKNLRFIRSYHPEHPLANPEVIASSRPPRAEWLYDWDSIMELDNRLAEYRNTLLHSVDEGRSMPLEQASESESHHPSRSNAELQFFGVGQNEIEQQLLASINQLNEPVRDIDVEDPLGRVVRQRLSVTCRPPNNSIDFSPHWSLLPVLSFGSIAAIQSQVVSRESLKLLVNNHDLRLHLKMHREFHLFGNGMYCSRLSHALFDPDLETAERTAGVARQGGVMGLRLAGRDTWPPASSELRLALMGVLAESFGESNGNTTARFNIASADSAVLPGDMSFAVRDLSQEEIDKCMNPDSLEALDFLRLSYKTPDALTAIITPMILMQYDRIFKLLLRVLRLLYVANQLFKDVNARTTLWENPSDASYRFAREANHFVSSIASYFLDTGVALPWQAFEAKLDRVQEELSRPASKSQLEKTESPNRLREFHSQVLDRIMTALFLRKRQQPVLKLMEDIFNSILHYAKWSRMQALGRDSEDANCENPQELYRKFKKKVQIFITVCRGLTEKGRLGSNKGEDDFGLNTDGIGEDHMIAQLLMKLHMNDYYTKH